MAAEREPFPPHFWVACAMHFAAAMSLALHILFPLFLRHHGGSDLTIGTYAGFAGGAAVLGRIPLGYLLDHVGRRPALWVAGLLNIIAWAGFLAVDQLGSLSFLLNLANGVASGALFASFFTYASDITPSSRRAEGLAFFGIWGLLPDGLAPLLGEYVLQHYSFAGYFTAATLLAAISFAISLFLPETRPRGGFAAHHADGHARLDLVGSGLLATLATVLMFGIAMHSLFVFFAPFSESTGRPAVSRFFLAYALTAASIRVVGARLPDRIGLRRVLLPALTGYGIGLCLLPGAFSTLPLALVGGVCGIGHGYSFPILTVLAISQASASARGRVVTLVTAMFDVGAMIAGPVLGGIAEAAGYPAMYRTVGAMTVLAAWAARERR